jgi:penicillin-binding protein 1A
MDTPENSKSLLLEDEPEPSEGRSRLLRRTLYALAVLAAALFGALAGQLLVYSNDLPEVAELERFRPSSITELYDIHGNIIGTFALQKRVVARYQDFPKVLRDAVISIEDKDFERHWGVDFQRVLGAAYRDVVSGSRSQGASTLTMQLSRNLFLSPERTFSRKMQEMMLAIEIERRFTKEQIFTLYANQIYLGHGVYGFEAGSEYYFSKPALGLTIAEAAVLAGLPKAPTTYSPISNPARDAAAQSGDQQHDGGRADHGQAGAGGQETAAGPEAAVGRPRARSLFCGGGAPLPGEKVRARRGA